MRASASQFFDADSKLGGAIISVRDITTERKMEQQIVQGERLAAMGAMIGGVAHELNNPLTSILGVSELLQDSQTSDAARKQVGILQQQARRAAEIVHNLTYFSRPPSPGKTPVNLGEIVERTLNLHAYSLRKNSISVDFLPEPTLPRVQGDPHQLMQVFLNLILNAEQAIRESRDRGTLRIRLGTTGESVWASFHDDGPGIPGDILASIFDPFYTTKGVGKGTGLGLSQVFGYVKQSGGHVKIYSEIGRGTTVKVYLPRYTGEDKNVQPAPPSGDIPRGDHNEIILVVEDDTQVRHMSVAALRELDYTIVQAATPSEALKQLELQPHISLLFTDVVMPEMSGRQLATLACERRPELKVLYTTGYTRNAVVHNGVLDSGTQLLVKPFTLEQLARKIREVLETDA